MEKQKRILVCGAGGFIGGHLVNKLKELGHWVCGVDLKEHEFQKLSADKFIIADLRDLVQVKGIIDPTIDEIYQLAADMGGSTYINIGEHDSDVMHNSCLINLNVLKTATLKENNVKKIFYASSACVYPEFNQEDPLNPNCKEDSVYPAQPDSEYGWEKLFSERLYNVFAKDYPIKIRIARFHNIYGPYGCYTGGREKAPAAICRKVALARDGDQIEVLGNGHQTRSFLYVDQCIEGILRLMDSNCSLPLNIGSEEMISINDFTKMIIKISGKKLSIKNIPYKGIGVMGRNSDNQKIKEILNWEPVYPLEKGIRLTYQWISNQVNNNFKFDIVIPIGKNDDQDQELLIKQLECTLNNIKTTGKVYLIPADPNFKIPIGLNRIKIIPEKLFPFNFDNYKFPEKRRGWYLQQLIKLYAYRIIENLTETYLVIDADTFFLKPTSFIDSESGKYLFGSGNEHHPPYFNHMKALHPNLKKVQIGSGICHHMIFNGKYLEELFELVSRNHRYREFWKVYLEMVREEDYLYSGASEYETYFNFMSIYHPDKMKIRSLRWANESTTRYLEDNSIGLDYLSYHWYLRN